MHYTAKLKVDTIRAAHNEVASNERDEHLVAICVLLPVENWPPKTSEYPVFVTKGGDVALIVKKTADGLPPVRIGQELTLIVHDEA